MGRGFPARYFGPERTATSTSSRVGDRRRCSPTAWRSGGFTTAASDRLDPDARAHRGLGRVIALSFTPATCSFRVRRGALFGDCCCAHPTRVRPCVGTIGCRRGTGSSLAGVKCSGAARLDLSGRRGGRDARTAGAFRGRGARTRLGIVAGLQFLVARGRSSRRNAGSASRSRCSTNYIAHTAPMAVSPWRNLPLGLYSPACRDIRCRNFCVPAAAK